MRRPIPLYEGDPSKLEVMQAKLDGVLEGIGRPGGDAEAVTHTSRFNADWDILLRSSGAEGLLGASAIRRGAERYGFERTGAADWSLVEGRTQFGEAHFHNLVNMATAQGLEWAQLPQTG